MEIASPLSYSLYQPATSNFQPGGASTAVSSENTGTVFQPVSEPEKASTTADSANSAEEANAKDDENTADSDSSSTNGEMTEEEQQQVLALSARDTEVRNHERAHAAVGGQYAGSPEFHYQRGPDGINYAVSGEVSISTSKVPGDPQATIEKAQVVRRAALAPAEPSAQDRRVAAMATQMEADARVELSQQRQEMRVEEAEEASSAQDDTALNDEPLTPENTANSAFFREYVNSITSEADSTTAIDTSRRVISSSYEISPDPIGRNFNRYA